MTVKFENDEKKNKFNKLVIYVQDLNEPNARYILVGIGEKFLLFNGCFDELIIWDLNSTYLTCFNWLFSILPSCIGR